MGMIKSDRELAQSKATVEQIKSSTTKTKEPWQAAAEFGIESFRLGIEEEIKEYENIKKGNIPEYLFSIENLGLLLIALRIRKGWTQARLAKELGVPASQVSRDENNDYYGVSLPTIKKILKAMDVELKIQID